MEVGQHHFYEWWMDRWIHPSCLSNLLDNNHRHLESPFLHAFRVLLSLVLSRLPTSFNCIIFTASSPIHSVLNCLFPPSPPPLSFCDIFVFYDDGKYDNAGLISTSTNYAVIALNCLKSLFYFIFCLFLLFYFKRSLTCSICLRKFF